MFIFISYIINLFRYFEFYVYIFFLFIFFWEKKMFSAFVVISMKPLPFYKQQYDLPFMFNILSIVCFPAQVYLA